MPPPKITYDYDTNIPSPVLREDGIEYGFIGKLQELKYEYRPDITNRATLEQNFREKFEALNRVRLPPIPAAAIRRSCSWTTSRQCPIAAT